jgi:dihydrofolate reductase
MGRIFSMSHSLDGYITDAEGRFDWGAPDEHIFRAALEEVRGLSAHFLGRRLYETMRYWEDPDVEPTFEPLEREFAEVWKALPKIVVSSTLDAAPGQNTTLLQGDLVEEIARLRDDDEVGEIAIGGATLAARWPQPDSWTSIGASCTRSCSAGAPRSIRGASVRRASNSSRATGGPAASRRCATAWCGPR